MAVDHAAFGRFREMMRGRVFTGEDVHPLHEEVRSGKQLVATYGGFSCCMYRFVVVYFLSQSKHG